MRATIKSGPGLRLAALFAAGVVPLLASAETLTFEKAFSTRGEPAALHYQARYAASGAEHRVEVWRDGDRRVKRRTDGSVETYAVREPASAEFHLSVLDLRKRIHTRIDRTNLYRLGNFTDWFDLTHALKHPLAGYHLDRTAAAAGSPSPVDPCEWYELSEGQRVTRICWGVRDRIPLLIQNSRGEVLWRVTAVERGRIPSSVFEIRDEGFVRNDANADIEAD